MRPSARLLLVAVLVALLATAGAVVVGTLATGDGASSDPEGDSFLTTELDNYDVRGLQVRRASFCAAIDRRQVAAALGADADSERTWEDGDRVEVSEGVKDVVHEYGCEYAVGDTKAPAWVFAPPVDRRRAQQLLKGFMSPACASLPASRYGEPSIIGRCDRQGVTTAIFAGLFGDAWLTCQLETRGPLNEKEFAVRSARWCVSTAIAAASEATAQG